MGWKIFFWVYLAFALLSYINPPESPSLIEIIGYPVSLIELMALYTYAFKKKILTTDKWKILLWVYVAFNVTMFLGEFTPLGQLFPFIRSDVFNSLVGAAKMSAIIVTLSFLVVFLYVLLRLAFPKIYKES